MPPQQSIFGRFLDAKMPTPSKIARRARQEDTQPTKYQGASPDNGKSGDPAKTTYSIPDFVIRNAKYCQYIDQYLEQNVQYHNINT